MKRFELKTVALLTLPALALLGFASILSLRAQNRGAPRVVTNEVVQLPNTNVLVHRIVMTKSDFPWWCRTVFGGNDFGARIQTSKIQISKRGRLRVLGRNDSENRNFLTSETWIEATPNFCQAQLRSIITWKQSINGQLSEQTINLQKSISARNFKLSKIITDTAGQLHGWVFQFRAPKSTQ